MSETRVVNVRRNRCDLMIDRSSPYGNRYVIGRDGNRATVIQRHEQDWRAMLAESTTRDQAVACLIYMKGKRLGCHCKPLPCHGDTYVQLIAEFCA